MISEGEIKNKQKQNLKESNDREVVRGAVKEVGLISHSGTDNVASRSFQQISPMSGLLHQAAMMSSL